MRYQISCIGKLSHIEENKIIQKYIKRVRNKIQIIEFPQSDIKKEGLKLLEYSPKNSILILLDKEGENLSTNKLFDLIKSYEMNNIKSNPDIRLINKLSQNVRVMCVRTVFFYLDF